ncbi:LMTD1 protein, partial [Polypterus senegalus]
MPHPASAVDNVANGTREVFYKAHHPQLSQHLNDCIRIVKSLRNQQTQFDSTAPLSEWLEEKIIAIQHLYESETQALHEKLRQLSHEKARMELNNFYTCQSALNYENRMSTMNSELFRKDEELRNLRHLLKENVNKGRSSSSVSMSSVYDLGSSDREELCQRVEEAKDRYENEYFHRLQLQDEVQMLKQKLELQEGFYSQESQKMRERISGSELYILQLEEQLSVLKGKQTGLEEKVGETNAVDETQPMWFNKEAEKDFSENLLDSNMQQTSDQLFQEKTGKENIQQQLQELTGEFTALETMAVAWYTPVHWNPRLQEAWQSDEFNSMIHDKEGSAASDHDDELIVQKVNEMAVADFEPLHNVQSKSLSNSKEEEQTFLLKREKEAPLVLFPTRSPWAQSSSSPTHPAYTLPRTLAKGNDGSSLCRQARSQSARPDPAVGELYASSMSSKSADPRRAHNVGAQRRGPTRSAGAGQPTQTDQSQWAFLSPRKRHKAHLQHLQSQINMSFQPPMPRPPPVASW